MKTRNLIVPVQIGTLKEIGCAGFQAPWIATEGRHGSRLSLAVSADLRGSSIHSKKVPDVYAKIDGRDLAQQVFALLEAEAAGSLAAEPEGETTQELARRFHGLLLETLGDDYMSLTEIATMLATAVRDGGH